jgi:hypothetical protein
MVNVWFLIISGVLGAIGYFTAGQFEVIEQSGQWAIALAMFFVFQFLVFTPIRMWQEAVEVRNVESLLADLLDLHDQGVKLLNRHGDYRKGTPYYYKDLQATQVWIDKWIRDVRNWQKATGARLDDLHPLESRKFRNIVRWRNEVSGGLSIEHDQERNMLLRRLDMLESTINRHQPALLPQ